MVHRGFHVGTVMLFIATVLLVISSISSPVTSDIGLMKITLNNATTIRHSSVNFGTLGFCILDVPPDNTDQDSCGPKGVKYDIAGEIAALGLPAFGHAQGSSLNGLTGVLILHEVAAGIAFIAFLLALVSHRIGFLLAAAVAFLAFLITLIAMAVDFALFGVVKAHVHNANMGMSAAYGVGTWTCLAAFVVLFFATFTTCCACVTGRREKRSTVATTSTRRGWWRRRNANTY